MNSCTPSDGVAPENTSGLFGSESHVYGWVPAPAEELAKIPFALNDRAALPASATLVTPPIGNQGQQGSCVGWCTGYSARSTMWHNKVGGAYSTATEFSPAYIYNQVKISTCSNGSYVTSALSLLKTKGVCTLASMAYTDKSCSAVPTAAQNTEAAKYKISSYSQVALNATAIKSQVAANNIVVVAGPVDLNFERLANGAILSTYNNKPLGGHCYAVVGYDDAKQAFKVQNQWGTGWASGGFGWISYSIISKIWQEAYVIAN